MDAGGLNQLIEYGILGLWTLSLLISNHTMRGNFQSRYDDLNKNVVDVLKKNKETIEENQERLDKALDKIDETLQTIKQKHLEEKLRAEMRNTQVLEQWHPPTAPLDTHYPFVYNKGMEFNYTLMEQSSFTFDEERKFRIPPDEVVESLASYLDYGERLALKNYLL